MEKKVKWIRFEDTLDIENVSNLVDKMQSYEKIRLYFSSPGGYTTETEYLVDYINSRKDDITIVFTNRIESCGFLLSLDVECEKLVSPELILGMVHLIDMKTLSHRGLDEINIERKSLQDINNKLIEKLEPHLLKTEIRRLKRGEDLFFDRDRVIKMITNPTLELK